MSMAEKTPSAWAGIAWMTATTLLFVTQDATMRVLTQSYPIFEVAWARFAVHMLWALLLVGIPSPRLMVSNRPGLQLLRSGLLVGLTLVVALSISLLPFVDVVTISNAAPVLVTALSVPLLGERVGWRRWMGVLAGFMGALMIVGPASITFQWAILLPLCAAFANALYQITTRLLSSGDQPLTTFFYTALVGTAVCSVALPFVWVTPDATGWALMLLIGTAGALSHFCMIRAYTAAPAATVAPFGYTTLVWALLCGVFIFGEVPSPSTLAGGVVIVGSGLYILYREKARVREG